MPLNNDILAFLLGVQWTPAGQGVTELTYTITGTDIVNEFGQTVNVVDPSLASAIHQGVAAWESVANVNFRFVDNNTVNSSDPFAIEASSADFTFAPGFLTDGVIGVAEIYGDPTITHVDVTLNDVVFSPAEFLPSAGGEGYLTLLHEIGHGLGLAHPDTTEGGSFIEGVQLTGDSITYDATVMNSVAGAYGTHSTIGGAPTSPQILDIQAIQHLYGANSNTASGDDIYVIDGSQVSKTIWDGGGTDTYDASSMSIDVILDLGESLTTLVQAGSSRIWSAYGSNIENATAGSGNDTLIGNVINNQLIGGIGNDTISGNLGDDLLIGNAGIDSISGDAGNDEIKGGQDNDIILGGEGDDILRGNLGDDNISGENGNDTIKGGNNADTINGNAGDDFVNGNIGIDTIDGGSGNDTLKGGKDVDSIIGGDGDDFIYGNLGNDTLTGGNGADYFVYNLGDESDVITDFSIGSDRLQFASDVFATADAAIASSFISGQGTTFNVGVFTSITLSGVTGMSASDIVIV